MPSQLDYKLILQIFQSQRLRRDHADLADEPQYRQIAEFFFEEMYGPHDFSSRDEHAYQLCDNYGDRMRQIELSRNALYNVYRMARKPLIGAVLQRTQGLAQTV